MASLTWIQAESVATKRSEIRSQAARWSRKHNLCWKSRSHQPKSKCRCLQDKRNEAADCDNPQEQVERDIIQYHSRPNQHPLAELIRPSDKSVLLQTFKTSYTPVMGQRGVLWIAQVMRESTAQYPLIRQSVAALVEGLCSRAFDAQELQKSASQRYSVVVRNVRRLIAEPAPGLQTQTVVIISILSLMELLVWDDSRKWMMHLDGLSNVTRHSEPSEFCGGVGFSTFRLARNLILAVDIFKRRKSFLADLCWMEEPWSNDVRKTCWDTSLDVILQFPELLELHDKSLNRVDGITKEVLDIAVLSFVQKMNEWKQRTISNIPTDMDSTSALEAVIKSLVEEPDKDQSNPEVALSIALHLSGWLLLVRLGPRYTNHLPQAPDSMVKQLLGLCRSYVGQQQTIGILPWMMPLRVAVFTPMTVKDATVDGLAFLRSQLNRQSNCSFANEIISSLPGLDTLMGRLGENDKRIIKAEL